MSDVKIQDEINLLVTNVDDVNVISDREAYELAGNVVLHINKLIKKVKDYWREPKKKAYDTHKEIVNKEKDMLSVLEQRKKYISNMMSSFLKEEERKRIEEQKRLDEERIRLEQQRKKELEEEARRKEEEAKRLEEAGKKQEADSAINQAIEKLDEVHRVHIPVSFAKPDVDRKIRTNSGTISYADDVEIFIQNKGDVLFSILNSGLPMDVVSINESVLKRYILANNVKQLSGVQINWVKKPKFRSV